MDIFSEEKKIEKETFAEPTERTDESMQTGLSANCTHIRLHPTSQVGLVYFKLKFILTQGNEHESVVKESR